MTVSTEVAARKAGLLQELEAEKRKLLRHAHNAHYASQLLLLMALACSVSAAIIGFAFDHVSVKLVATLAAIPPLIAFVASSLKLDARAKLHRRKCDGLEALRSRLLYQLPEEPSIDQISAIAAARDRLHEVTQSEWDSTIITNWNEIILRKASADAHPQPKSGN